MTSTASHKPLSARPAQPLMSAGFAAAFIAVLLTACSSGSGGDAPGQASDQVASVVESDAPSSTREASAEGDPTTGKAPQRRLDTTEAETLAMFQPYLQCLKDRDVPVDRAGRTNKIGEQLDPDMLWYVSVDMADYPAAEKACNPIRPLMPRELDPKTNPDYMKDFRAQIECMEARGVKVTGLPDGSGYNYRDGYEPTDETPEIEDECQLKAFGGQD